MRATTHQRHRARKAREHRRTALRPGRHFGIEPQLWLNRQMRLALEHAGRTQAQLAECIGVGQRQVSKIEQGDLNSAKVATVRSYFEAVGGELALGCVMGDQRMLVT